MMGNSSGMDVDIYELHHWHEVKNCEAVRRRIIYVDMSGINLFGFSGSKDKRVPVLNALQQQRLKQIESLKTFHPSVTEIQKNVKFKITFFIEDKPLNLYVFLPPNFPTEIPVVTVSPAIKHPWINDQMVVKGCDSLNQFYMHSNLGRAIQDVCKEFLEHPPTIIQYGTHTPVSTSQSHIRPKHDVGLCLSSISTTLVETDVGERTSSCPNNKLEGFSKITQTLDNCSIEELRDLDNNPEKLMKLIFEADLISSSAKNREDQMIRIEEIAKENMEQRPKLYEARQRLVEKYDELSQLRAEFDRWSSVQNDLLEMRTPDHLHVALQLGVSEMDEKSEKVADQFLNENLEIDEFIRSFTEKRKLTHIRHWKQENVRRL